MSTIEDLHSVSGLFAECPNCGENFALREANLFDATKPLPKIAIEYLQTQKTEIAREIKAIQQERVELKRRSFTSAETSGFGQIVEMLSPSLPGFPLSPSDCRALWQPIDYIGFKGLSMTGEVEALVFIEVKSGSNDLTPQQRQIKRVVLASFRTSSAFTDFVRVVTNGFA
jgi:predicted Holliday junction resolvase-like endonuclease